MSEENLEAQVMPPTTEQIGEAILETGLFKPKTEYILIGDEVRGSGVVDLKTMLNPEDYDSLKQLLTLMPRYILRDWFLKTVWPNLPDDFLWAYSDQPGDQYSDEVYGGARRKKRFEDLVWAAFVDLFNEANLKYVNDKQIEPWTWEQEKLESYMISQDRSAISEIEQQFTQYEDVGLAQDPKAKAIMEQLVLLPKLGDTGLEINRQNAVRELLKMKDYETAQAVIDVFRYLDESPETSTALKNPIPFDIVTTDGVTIKRTEK